MSHAKKTLLNPMALSVWETRQWTSTAHRPDCCVLSSSANAHMKQL